MQLDDRFEIKVIERCALARRAKKNAKLIFVNLDPRLLLLRENLQDTLCMRLQMPEHVATRARSSHGCEREEGENACTFRGEGGGKSREFISWKRSRSPWILLFIRHILYILPNFSKPLSFIRAFVGQEGINFPSLAWCNTNATNVYIIWILAQHHVSDACYINAIR